MHKLELARKILEFIGALEGEQEDKLIALEAALLVARSDASPIFPESKR